MKVRIFSISVLILFSTSCNEQSFLRDDIILQCYHSKYQEHGYNIKTIIEDYEKLLVKEGILKDDSGKSYLEVLQKIASDKNFKIKTSTFQEFDPWHKVDKETAVAVFECEFEMLESAKEKDSEWHKLLRDFESPEIKENPELVYQYMVEALSEDDLNSFYFKLKMFHVFDMVNSKWGDRSLIPPVSSN